MICWKPGLIWMLVITLMLSGPGRLARGEEKEASMPVVDAQTEAVIQGAMKFLATKQTPSGAWSAHEHQVAVTGYVLMAYLAAGNLPGEGEYGKTVSRGMQFLLDCVRSDGYIIAPSEFTNNKGMYGHGIATIALSELYGQTKDPNVRTKLQRAVNLIVSCQNPRGGWRYFPRIESDDISVTVLQVVSLRAAKNAGLDVPDETLKRAVDYVKKCFIEKAGGFAYQPGGGAGFARTAAAIYSLQVCGLYDDPMVARGSKYLIDRRAEQQWLTYGNFYAAPAQYMVGGETWKNWYVDIHDRLMKRVQNNNGMCFWEPLEDRAKAQMNDVYATAIYSMILSMPWSYIPLYQR